ncbi:ATP synthase F0 subunit 6 (mitochondrion) [Saccoglossus kowalevskii]|uniref:ATP synthase subunit a n=1 Tax=Saccoglossus kowalevskii TaxID=10224 RepID=Q3L8T7_SACKO|nr:ATP synthase F0 subunit 6 [Saccoglossus kowalevskii]AAQ92981.1 ATP synthase F0 subunit 6 [Saccoglossus kowalevskii]
MTVSLFDQFNPPITLNLPMIVPSLLIALLWTLLLFTPNQFPTRFSVLWQTLTNLLPPLFLRSAGPSSSPWAPLIFALFITLLSNNLLGLTPHSFTPTSHFSLTLSLAIPLWLAVTILGFRRNFNLRLSHLLPQGTPPALIPLLVWIELLSLLAQPLALALRLAANLTAGHLLIYLLSAAGWLLTPTSPIVGGLISITLFLLLLLEIAVAVIQAYVFATLTSFYLQQNT